MNRDNATKIHAIMLDVSRQLDETVSLVEKSGDDDLLTYKRAVAEIVAAILIGVLNPLHEKYPDLKPEGFE